MIVTAEIGYLNPNTSPESSGTLYLASEHFVTKSTDTLANTYFAGRLDGEVRYALKLSTQFWGGNSTIGIGSLDIINDDGELDDWASYEFRDQAIVIKSHTRGASYNSAVVLVRGTIDKLEVTGEKRLRLVIRDPAEQLQVPITSTVFSGGTDADGLLKPILFGSVKSAKPILVDEASNGYEVSDLEILQIDDIYDQGVSVGLNYTQTTYGFDLDSTPTGKVVADITGAGVGVTTYTLVKKNPPGPVYDGYTSLYNFGTSDPAASPNLSAYYWRSQLARNVADGGKYYVEFKVIIYDHTSASPDNAPDWNLGCGLSTLSGTPPFYGKPNNADEYTLLFEDTGVNGGPVIYSFWENGVLDSGPTTSASGWFNDRIGMLVDFDNDQVTWTFNGVAFGPTLSIAAASPEQAFYPIVAAASKGTNQNNAIQIFQHEDDLLYLPASYTPWGGADPTADESFEELCAFITDRIPALTFDSTSVQAINALTYGSPAAEYTYGFQYSDTVTAAQILNAALGSIGGYWFVNRTGDIEVGQLTAPATAALEFDDDEILGEISLRPDNAPGLVKGAGANRNWEVMRESEFAAGATQTTRQQFSRRFRDEYRNSTTLPGRYSHAAGAPLGDNLLTSTGAAEAEADRWATLYQTRRYFWNVDIAATTDKFDDLLDAIGDTVQITSDRFNLDNGKALRLVGVEGAFLSNVIRMTLWGEGATPLPAAAVPLSQNLISYWNGNDGTTGTLGTVADGIGTNTLTKTGAGTLMWTTSSAQYKYGSAVVRQGGAGAYLTTSAADNVVPSGSWTVTFWVKHITGQGSTPSDDEIMGVWGSGSDKAWVVKMASAANHPDGTQGIYVAVSEDGSTIKELGDGGDAGTYNQKYFVAARYDADTRQLKLRINDNADSVLNDVLALNPSAEQLTVFRAGNDSFDWGVWSMSGLWGRCLSDAEIDAVYNGGAGLLADDIARFTDAQATTLHTYASLAAAKTSGDAWSHGDVIRLCAGVDSRVVDFIYDSAISNSRGLFHRHPYGYGAGEFVSLSALVTTPAGADPDFWANISDLGSGVKGTDYEYDQDSGSSRIRKITSSGIAAIRSTTTSTANEQNFVIVDDVSETSSNPSTAAPTTTFDMYYYNPSSPISTDLLRVSAKGDSADGLWHVYHTNATTSTSTGKSRSATRRIALYAKSDKWAIWFDDDVVPAASGTTPRNIAADATAITCLDVRAGINSTGSGTATMLLRSLSRGTFTVS